MHVDDEKKAKEQVAELERHQNVINSTLILALISVSITFVMLLAASGWAPPDVHVSSSTHTSRRAVTAGLHCNHVAFLTSMLSVLVLLQLTFWQLVGVPAFLDPAFVRRSLACVMASLACTGVALVGAFLAVLVYTLDRLELSQCPLVAALLLPLGLAAYAWLDSQHSTTGVIPLDWSSWALLALTLGVGLAVVLPVVL